MISAEQIVDICSVRCGAKCCRGPNQLMLSPSEAKRLETLAAARRIEFTAHPTVLNNGMYMDVPKEGCAFLGDDNLCGIYDERPQACRVYPFKADTMNCELSGWVKPPKIFIGVPRGGDRINLAFELSRANLMTYLQREGSYGGGSEKIGPTIDDNQNDLAGAFLESKADYLFLVEDDMVFKPQSASMLAWKMEAAKLKGVDMRILSGLYFQRSLEEPIPHIYRRTGVQEVRGEKAITHTCMLEEVEALMEPLPIPEGNDPYVLKPDLPSVMQVDAATTGFLMIARSALEQIPFPWFRRMGAKVGEPGRTAPDLAFFFRAAQVGIDTYADVGVYAGHLQTNPMGVKTFREWRAATAKEEVHA